MATNIDGTEPTAVCPCCTEPGTLTCAGCHDIDYCSIECQETDWTSHKHLCRSFTNFSHETRPSENMRRCILFPPDSGKPNFIWLEVKEFRGDDGVLQYKQPNMAKQMGTEAPYFDTVVSNEVTAVKLDRHIHVCYHEDALERYSEDNNAVRVVTGGLARCSWRGPIVAYCGTPDDLDAADADIMEVGDMGMLEYSHVVAHFIDWQNDEKRYLAIKGPKVEVVKAFADDAMEGNGGLRFKAVKMPRMHPVVRAEGEISAVSMRIGMPLVCVKYPIVDWTNSTNSIIASMQIHLDPDDKITACNEIGEEEGQAAVDTQLVNDKIRIAETAAVGGYLGADEGEVAQDYMKTHFGKAGAYWHSDAVGNVLIFREDFSPVTVEVVEAFTVFCKNIESYITYAEAEFCQDLSITKESAIWRTTEEKWEEFLHDWRTDKISVLKDVLGKTEWKSGDVSWIVGFTDLDKEVAEKRLAKKLQRQSGEDKTLR